MKVKRTSSVLAALAFSHQVSVPVHAKKDSTKGLDSHSTKNDSNSVTASESSLFDDLFGQPIPSNAIDSTSVVVPDPSSSLRRRDLKKDSSKYFFFEDCSDTCAENDGVATSLDDGCCAGGVSFLKVKFQAQDQIRGTITLGSTNSLSCEGPSSKPSSKGTWGHKGSKGGVIPKPSKPSQSPSNYELRIVDCDATCIQDPFGGKTCKEDPTLAKKDVVSGSEICFAMIKSESDGSYKVAFDEKMPTDIYVLFLSSEGFSVGAIHTSCSVPLSQSWGVRLEDPCNDSPSYTSYKTTKAREKHFNIRDNKSVGTPYLSFVDGISTKYYNAVEHIRKEPDTLSYLRDFSIRFKNCGCTCENFNKTPGIDPNITPIPIQNVTPSPISSPTYIPSLVPTELPIADPTSSPTTKPTLPSTANPTHSPTTNPSPYPTEHTTSFTTYATSSSTTTTGPTIVSDPDGGPGSPTSSVCSSTCAAFIQEHCVFAGTNKSCNIFSEVPALNDNGSEENAQFATFFPTTSDSAEVPVYGIGKSGKGTKGGKDIVERSSGLAGGKGMIDPMQGEHARKKHDKTMHLSYGNKQAKQGKGYKSGPYGYFGKHWYYGQIDYYQHSGYYEHYERNKVKGSKSGYGRHLQKIKYHQNEIERLKKLLVYTNV